MSIELENYVQSTGLFVTELDEIVNLLLKSKQVFLYDTAAISLHENVFYHHQVNYLEHFISDSDPVIITDTIVKEMKFLEDVEDRYLNYLKRFGKVIFIKEEDFYKLLTDFYKTNEAKGKFLAASEKAFSDILPLKNEIAEIRKNSFNRAESMVLDKFNTFFYANNEKNRGEISLLWLSSILNFVAPKLHLNFIGHDSDLFTYVHRCYLRTPLEHTQNLRDIRISSNDTLIQGIHTMNLATPSPNLDFEGYLELYRKPDRNVFYFEKQNGIKSHNMKKGKIANNTIKDAIRKNEIEIVY